MTDVRYTLREFNDVRWAVVDEHLHPVASGMTEADAHRVAAIFNAEHATPLSEVIKLCQLAEGDDAGLFLSSLPPAARESVKEETIRQALNVGKQIGALEEREEIVAWLYTMQDDIRPLAPDLLADVIKAEKHKP